MSAAVAEADAPGVLRRWPDRWVLLGLALLAVAVRLVPLLLGGGLGSFGHYDDGVYYSAADALSFGRAPYRDFVLLHPPGIMLVLFPFALLGRATTDLAGWETARVFFMAVGGLNTVLVAVIARRWSRPAMWVAGVMYACWVPAIYAEQSTFLEPIGGLFVLLALWLLVRTDRRPTVRAEWLAGISLGLAESVKIWYVAPWAVLVGWQLLARRWHSAARIIAGGVAALAIVIVPFAIASHGRIYDFVIRDQLLRPPSKTSRVGRIPGMLGIKTFTNGHGQLRHLFAALLIVLLVAVILGCLRERKAWPLLAVLAVNAAVLFVGPVFFQHYASFTAAPTAIVVGIGAASMYSSARLSAFAPVVTVAGLVLFLGSGVVYMATRAGVAFPGRAFAAAAPPGCIAADDPAALVEMDRLSSDLRDGCQVAVDVTGATYDWVSRTDPDGTPVPRSMNLAFQGYLYHYLTSANAFVICRVRGDALTLTLRRHYHPFRILARTPAAVLRRGAGIDPPAGVLP